MNSLDAMMPRAFPTLGFCGVSTVVAAGIGAIYSQSLEGAVTGATLNLGAIGVKVILDGFLRTGEKKVATMALTVLLSTLFIKNSLTISSYAKDMSTYISNYTFNNLYSKDITTDLNDLPLIEEREEFKNFKLNHEYEFDITKVLAGNSDNITEACAIEKCTNSPGSCYSPFYNILPTSKSVSFWIVGSNKDYTPFSHDFKYNSSFPNTTEDAYYDAVRDYLSLKK